MERANAKMDDMLSNTSKGQPQFVYSRKRQTNFLRVSNDDLALREKEKKIQSNLLLLRAAICLNGAKNFQIQKSKACQHKSSYAGSLYRW